MPFDEEDVEGFLHYALMPMLGYAVGEMFSLDRLAEHCAQAGTYEGMFVSAPLNKRGGIGSPPNAVAIV